jgi:hypothetical protein
MSRDREILFSSAVFTFFKNALTEARRIENELRSQAQVASRSTIEDLSSWAEEDGVRLAPYNALFLCSAYCF